MVFTHVKFSVTVTMSWSSDSNDDRKFQHAKIRWANFCCFLHLIGVFIGIMQFLMDKHKSPSSLLRGLMWPKVYARTTKTQRYIICGKQKQQTIKWLSPASYKCRNSLKTGSDAAEAMYDGCSSHKVAQTTENDHLPILLRRMKGIGSVFKFFPERSSGFLQSRLWLSEKVVKKRLWNGLADASHARRPLPPFCVASP